MDYKKRRDVFKKQIHLFGGNASKIWVDLRKDFQKKDSTLRGYGLSTLSEKQRKIYLSLSKILNFPFNAILKLFSKPKQFINRTLSWLLLEQDSGASNKFDFDSYPSHIYEEDSLGEFLEEYSKYNIGFSHNTFKSFNYLKNLKKNVPLQQDLKIFEIGAGVFNFGHLLSFEQNLFEYVICDLPEMIVQAHQQITELYIPKCGGDYEVFLPHEIELFNNSSYGRKILFITPEQLDEGVLGQEKKFDLFINHESFAEMEIGIVNNYLGHMAKLMKVGSIINIVNRHSRPQAKSYDDYSKLELENITCFDQYELEFCECLIKEVDKFRAKIPGQQTKPNIFFIGKMKI